MHNLIHRPLPRRNFLRTGVLGGLGLSLPELLRAEAEGGATEKKNAIFIYLDGGQSQMDSWDPKPDGGDAAGEFKPIATNLDGLQVCEHMPHLAKVADTYAVVRSVKDAIAVHGIGMTLVRTGNRPQASLVYPDVGSVICRERVSPKGIPPFVSLPVVRTNSTTESPGYLGVAYGAFTISGDPNAEDFSVRALKPPTGMPEHRFNRRFSLVKQIDLGFRDLDLANKELDGMDRFYQQAFDILSSPQARQAFDLSHEKDAMRDRYGRTNLGQACLLARRLVEAGVRCVTIDFGGWDTHQKNFSDMKDKLLPPWDQALAALLTDLKDRGLLDSTVVWSTGEMGRTPKINDKAGRDHWGKAMSMMLAGGGIRGGQVIGATDKEGGNVTEDPCTPGDVAASVLRAMGIDPKKEYHTPTGRPIQIVHDGKPIRKLFG